MKKRKLTQQNRRLAKNSQINAVNGLGYSGEALIEIYNGNTLVSSSTYYNHGTVELCKYICYNLIGQPNVAKMPGGLMICNRPHAGGKLENMLDYCISYIHDETTKPNVTDFTTTDEDMVTWKGSKYTLSFGVHGQLLAGINKLSGLRLYSLDFGPESGDLYAEIDFGEGNELDISNVKDSTIIIKWTLTVSAMQTDVIEGGK